MANNDLQANAETIGRKENRQRLARATIEYFESRSPSEIAEDQSFTESLSQASDKVNFDEGTEDRPAK
jgi:hypothetical protein